MNNSDTNLFLIRLRTVPGSDGPHEWEGSVVNVSGSEAYRFTDWPGLIDILLEQQARCEEASLRVPLISAHDREVGLNGR
jgi:hypothetical protein